MTDDKISVKRLDKLIEGSRNNADSIGISGAVIASWIFTTYSGVVMPAEVVAAMGGLIGAISARIKK